MKHSEKQLRTHFEENLKRDLTEKESQFISWMMEQVSPEPVLCDLD